MLKQFLQAVRQRADADDGTAAQSLKIMLFGATGGLGQALVRALCRLPKSKRPQLLVLCGRSSVKLQQLSRIGAEADVKVRTVCLDLRDLTKAQAALEQAAALGINKLVLASGVSLTADGDGLEGPLEIERGFRVNTLAPCTLTAAAARLLPKGSQVVVLSSLASRLPLPSSAVYCASKAALSTYVRALRPQLQRAGITLSLVEPGYFESAMSERYQGSKPYLMTADHAAAKVLAVMSSLRKESAFPLPLHLGSAILMRLPQALQSVFLQHFFKFSVLPDADAAISKSGGRRC